LIPSRPAEPPDSTAFDPRDCLAQTLQAQEPHARARGLALTGEVSPVVPAQVVGDPHRLGKLLTQLIDNVLCGRGDGTVAVRVDQEATTPETVWLHFTVRDPGPGLTTGQHQRLEALLEDAQAGMLDQPDSWPAVAAGLAGLLGGRVWLEGGAGRETVWHAHARFGLPGAAGLCVLDRAATLGRMDNDRQLLGELIDLFLAREQTLLGQVWDAWRRRDAEGLRRACHALKGQVSFFGAGTLAEALGLLHRRGGAGEPAQVEGELTALDRQFQALRRQLREFREELTDARADR
jgi:HPt (histidine-containing phosphotransfer) domain-containing protein